MNLVMLPMWIPSGTFFSYSSFFDAALARLGAPIAIVVAWGAVSL